jgi:membrane AbrB-like protein
VIHFATNGTLHQVIPADLLPWASIGLLVVTAIAGGALLARVRFPNSWFLGALLGAALLGGFGVVHGRVPDWLLIMAQVIIGCSLGAQFRQEFVTRLLHTMLASIVTVLFSGCTMALVAAAFAYALGYPVPTMVLAFAPAGMAEMTLTGKVLGLDAALIASFHVLRVIMVLVLCVPGFRLFERLAIGRSDGRMPD